MFPPLLSRILYEVEEKLSEGLDICDVMSCSVVLSHGTGSDSDAVYQHFFQMVGVQST